MLSTNHYYEDVFNPSYPFWLILEKKDLQLLPTDLNRIIIEYSHNPIFQKWKEIKEADHSWRIHYLCEFFHAPKNNSLLSFSIWEIKEIFQLFLKERYPIFFLEQFQAVFRTPLVKKF